MASRTGLYLLPSAAVLVVAVLVLGPGRDRPVLGARVWGVPAEGTKALAWRIDTLTREADADQLVSVEGLHVTVSKGDRVLAETAFSTDARGLAEVVLETSEAPSGPLDVRIARGKELLLDGSMTLVSVPELSRSHVSFEGKSKGKIAFSVEIERGILASPFPGRVRVTATRDGKAVSGAVVVAKATGATVLVTSARQRTDDLGQASIGLVPTWHSIELSLEATSEPDPLEKSTWEGSIPVKPGALWFAIEDARAKVISPVPRERAYLSILGDRGRVAGLVVPLARSDKGEIEGSFDWSTFAPAGARAVTVATDPYEHGSGTVTWPLEGIAAVERAPRIGLLIDGLPLASRIEKKRARSVRMAAFSVAFVTAVFEAILLVLYSRASQEKLRAHLARVAEEDGESGAADRMIMPRSSRAFSLIIAVGLILLAFGAVAGFSIVH